MTGIISIPCPWLPKSFLFKISPRKAGGIFPPETIPRRVCTCMSNSTLIKWSVWMGVFTFIYCFIYVLLPIYKEGVMWMTFVALPIYLNGGAKKEEFPRYFCSMIAGIAWGLIYLKCINTLAALGMAGGILEALNMGLICGGVTIICCIIHFVVTPKIWLNKIPMMFGAISMTFSQGGDLKRLPFIFCTLGGGLVLGLACGLGPGLLGKKDKPE
jgi:hypothetical protein